MRMKKPTLPKKSPRLTGTIGVRAIFLAGICVMGAAIVIAARKPSTPGETAAADVHLEKAGAVDAYARKAAASKAAAATTSGAEAKGGKASAAKAAPVTITGCLEKSDETFRLKDTSGTDVPKARSWKSGFLKKGSASIDVVDGANKVKLPSHVGERVSVTGTLVDREMQVRSLQRVSASCSKNAGA
jgi:hypothetical protein